VVSLTQTRLALGAAAFVLLAALTTLAPAQARAEAPGRFDYYVLALSWSPSYCARAGRKADPTQCKAARPFRFIVHGLWPQYDRGYPDFCDAGPREPDRATVNAMLDIMPSRGLVRHQWRKHGSCSGLSPAAYFDLTRRAFDKIRIPPAFNTLSSGGRVSPDAVEKAFRLANPGLRDAAMAVACQDGRLSEVRLCLTRDLDFRTCRAVDRRGCRQKSISVPAPGR
jgi:ribonuclease T2